MPTRYNTNMQILNSAVAGSRGSAPMREAKKHNKIPKEPRGEFRVLPVDDRREMQQQREDGREARPSPPRHRHAPLGVFRATFPARRLGVRAPAIREST
jgi:hypothetical protein